MRLTSHVRFCSGGGGSDSLAYRNPAGVAFFPHEVDHVVAEKHGGPTDETNLSLTCWRCNRHKGTDLGSFDPDTGAFSMLFNPRTQHWREHFAAHDGVVMGLTPEGRTTVRLLQINLPERVRERQRLTAVGRYPGDEGAG